MSQDSKWKTPNEIIKLQLLKQKQKALQARLKRPSQNSNVIENIPSSSITANKRRNPFLDDKESNITKRIKTISLDTNEFNSEDSVFNLLANGNSSKVDCVKSQSGESLAKFYKTVTDQDAIDSDIAHEEESKPTSHLPIDWSLKLKLRILSNGQIPGGRLKSSEEASGITGFVRCADLKSFESGVDISPAARFHQSTMYWQHPYLPWLTLFPRMSKANNGINIGENERTALARDWVDSFRSLFQLVRSLQCPYFYVCANSFTVLFRAAGIGGKVETHALLTPTSRGFRASLKEEDIEFSMPLKKNSENQNKSLDSGNDTQSNSFTEDGANNSGCHDESLVCNNTDDEDEETWLANLGVEASEIKKISTTHARRIHESECANDATDESIILIEGVECQAFFNFLLNAKSTTTKVGRLAGVPPTLIAPIAFPGATLRNVQVRSSIVRMNNVDYHSMELKGVILPHILQYLCSLFQETKDKFSATMVNFTGTSAMSKAAQKIVDDLNKENKQSTIENVFGRENLSDCGFPSYLVHSMCRLGPDAVRNLERMCYNKQIGGFTWT